MRLGACLALLLVLLSGSAVSAEETHLWKVVDKWQVRLDPTLNNGCFIMLAFERATVLRVGFDNRGKQAYVMLGHADWQSLADSTRQRII